VLLNGGAMVELRCGFLKKHHRIAVGWRVKDGGAMADVRRGGKWRNLFFFVRGRSWADPTQPYPKT